MFEVYRDEVVKRVYARYQERLLLNNAVDFDDLLMRTALLFEEQPEVLARYQRNTGHVLIGFSGQVDLFEVLDQCLPRLGEIHLHDAPWFGNEGRIGYDRDHVALGRGDLDVGRLVDTLEAANWDGPVILEMKLFSHVLESVDLLRTLRPEAMPVAAA